MAKGEYTAVPMTEAGIRLDEISEMGAMVPPGHYKFRLARVDAKDSSKGTPMVVASFDVLDGECAINKDGERPDINTVKGLEIRKYISLYVGKNDKGRTIAPGIMEFKAAAQAVGATLPEVFPGDVKQAARLVHQSFHPSTAGDIEGYVTNEKDKDDPNKTRTNLRIVGKWGGGSVAAAPAAAPAAAASSYV